MCYYLLYLFVVFYENRRSKICIIELKGLIVIIIIKEGGLHFNWES